MWNFQAQPHQSKAWRFIVMLFSFLNPDQAKKSISVGKVP
jgi:hypothetical protein